MTLTDENVENQLPRLAELGLATSPSGGAGLAAALIGAHRVNSVECDIPRYVYCFRRGVND